MAIDTPPQATASPAHPTASAGLRRPDPSTYDRSQTTQLNLRVDSALAERLAGAVEALRAAGLRKPTQYEVVEALLAAMPTDDGPALLELADQVVELRRRRI